MVGGRLRRWRAGDEAAADRLGLIERARLRQAFLGLVSGLGDGALALRSEALLRFAAEQAENLGIDPLIEVDGLSRDDRVQLLRMTVSTIALLPVIKGRSRLDRQLAWIGDTLGLNALDRRILALFARHQSLMPWRELADTAGGVGNRRLRLGAISGLTGAASDAIEARLGVSAPLIRTGLIIDEQDGDYRADRFLYRITRLPSADPAALAERMLPPAPPPTIGWDAFAHLGPARDLAAAAVSAAAAGNGGINILLHGLPGTGKSEFARAIAQAAGLTAIFAGLTDEQGDEPGRRDRLAHFSVLRALTRDNRNHLLVVDEADDMLSLASGDTDARGGMSKLWLNRLVEEVHAPTVWITNDSASLGPAVVRRMHLAIAFPLPPVSVRARVARATAAKAGVALEGDELAAVAALPIAPAVLANAAETARLAGGGGETMRRAGEGVLTALGGTIPAPAGPSSVYDPALAQADRDLTALTERLAGIGAEGWSLLLSGPSGTGKSAYAHHLARALNVEIIEKRGADLLGPFVGQTEANIAAAFHEAGERGALLLIDEADSFLFDRHGAERSWESGMVNEMLRWMERLRAPFVATTNLTDRLDPATQRRFTLRVAFRPLTPARAAVLFERYFGERPSAGIEPLEGLTPGDFGLVAARARLLGERDPAVLLAWLAGEAEARGRRPGRTGFHLPAPELRVRGIRE